MDDLPFPPAAQIPSLLFLCCQVIADNAEGLVSLDHIPNELVVEIVKRTAGDKLAVLEEEDILPDGVDTQTVYKKSCRAMLRETDYPPTVAAVPSSPVYWKQLFLTLLLQEKMSTPGVLPDADAFEQLLDTCGDYVQFLKLPRVEPDLLGPLTGRLRRLQLLDLSNCGLRDVDARALSRFLHGHTSLKMLLLRRNALGDTGVEAICDGLKENTSVVFVNLNWCWFTNQGATRLARLLVQPSCSIRGLDVRWNKLTLEGREVLRQAVKKREREGRTIQLQLV